jgi:glycine dehydrogenase subunit 2
MSPQQNPGPQAIERSKVETAGMFEESRPGRRAVELPAPGVPARSLDDLLPANLRRKQAAELPELGELQMVRHFTRLSQKNYSIDGQFYPLGSCTMKYNPRINEVVAAMPGFADIHPYQAEEDVQGALQVFHELEQMLGALTGLDAVSLQPAAGAHGEFTGLLCIRAYHHARGDMARTKVLIPDSAHGTNPATVTLAGMDVIPVRTAPDGGVDMKDLESRLGRNIAALMITNPSTLGLFERNIRAIADKLHAAGALLYMDGANMNALLGVVRPGDFGVDVMHINMHKTLSTPHGGGGPGSGPIAVRKNLEPFLPVPRIVKDGNQFRHDYDRPKSIGKVKQFYGHAGMVWRAYTYLRSHSLEDLRGIARNAVLNANYVLARLKHRYDLPYEGPCMHEVVLSARRQKKQGVRGALDVAKRLLDYGFHPPTIYFPLIVEEALMIEPTESEAKETLDRFCEAMIAIADEAEKTPDLLRNAPTTLPVRRLDEVNAAKSPVLSHRHAAQQRPEELGAPAAVKPTA